MIIREFTERDTQNKNRIFVEIKCDVCTNISIKQKRQVTEFEGKHWCCAEHMSIIKGTRVYVNCAHCGASSTKPKSALNNSKSGLYFCDRACKEAGQSYIKEIQPGHYGTGKHGYRKLAFDNKLHECNICGFDEHIAALVVHHVDRDRDNNLLSNLQILCANCHAIEHWGIAEGSRLSLQDD